MTTTSWPRDDYSATQWKGVKGVHYCKTCADERQSKPANRPDCKKKSPDPFSFSGKDAKNFIFSEAKDLELPSESEKSAHAIRAYHNLKPSKWKHYDDKDWTAKKKFDILRKMHQEELLCSGGRPKLMQALKDVG